MNCNRIFDILPYQKSRAPLDDALARREDKKIWTKYSTQEIIDASNQLSTALLNFGLKKGDKIAVISTNNRPEWHILDIASLQIGVVNVPIYPTISAQEYQYILTHADIQYLFVSDKLLHRKIQSVAVNIPSVKDVISFDFIPNVTHWKDLLKQPVDLNAINSIKNTITEEDIATIIYTSGTTGHSKGVLLSHKNIMSNVKDCVQVVTIQNRDRALSFLPLCHVFERILNYAYMYAGASIYFADGLETIAINLVDVRPQYFATVPRLMEKIYEGIERKARKLPSAQRRMYNWAVRQALTTPIDGSASTLQKAKLAVADKLVLNKWRAALGGNVKAIICGSASLQPRLATLFINAGIPVLEGYGLTETSPVLTVNPPIKGKIKAGSVGVPLPSVQIKLADDGEILAKAPNVMKGYYKDEKSTKESFTEDGWLKTGDIGKFTEDNYLVITDRKKELFKTSGGKYVAPAIIENKLKESPFIEQVAVVGDGMKFISALIVPNFDFLKSWCEKNNINFESNQQIITDSTIKKMYFDIIQKINVNFSKVEQIKKIALLDKEWTVEGGELTATMKLKRKSINEKYQATITGFYE